MRRCAKKVSRNLNESVHAKLWRKVLKFKFHTKARYRFACLMVVLEHNCHVMEPAEKVLRYKDTESVRVASRKHKVVPDGVRTKHRMKINYRNIVNNVNNNGYEAGMEPINRTNE